MTLRKFLKHTLLSFLLLIAIGYGLLVGLIEFDRFSVKTFQKKQNQSDQPAVESLSFHTKNPQQITLINSGLASLWKRIDLIRSAKKSIEMEYFIYNLDRSSRILNRELILQAQKGIKVRIIVDYSKPVFQLDPFVAAFLKQSGIEVRYYNTASMFNVFGVQHRSHRKLLIVDDQFVITGGRNVADEYFDLSENYNFLDTDILIEGTSVAEIKKGFDFYWKSNLSDSAEKFQTAFSEEQLQSVVEEIKKGDKDDAVLAEISQIGKRKFQESFKATCNDFSYVTDFPGASVAHRKVYNQIIIESERALKEIIVESPNFVLKTDGMEAIKNLVNRGVHFKVLTNSLQSTDAFYTVSAFFATMRSLVSLGLEVWGYSGGAFDSELKSIKQSGRWGLHSKRAVIDGETTLIGTYNIDPRSANLNSELMVVCRNQKELAEKVLLDINSRFANSLPLVQKNCLNCWTHVFKGASFQSQLLFFVFIPVSSQFDFLL